MVMDSSIAAPDGAADDDFISRLPDVTFSDIGRTPPPPGFVELVDAALAHNHETLTIHVERPRHKYHANAWLQQAAKRVHGKISLWLNDYSLTDDDIEDKYAYWRGFGKIVLDLPCARTASLSIRSSDYFMTSLRVPVAPAVNDSLTELELDGIRLEGDSLSDFLSSCGQLRRLVMHWIEGMDGQDLRISNKLLEELSLDYIDGLVRLEVSCPKLRLLRLNRLFAKHDGKLVGSFCTPCLEEIDWPLSTSLPKSRVEFLSSMDTVRRLNVGLLTHVHTYESQSHVGAWLLRSCTGVHRLDVALWNITKVGNSLSSELTMFIYLLSSLTLTILCIHVPLLCRTMDIMMWST
jgi:hypothetical protein